MRCFKRNHCKLILLVAFLVIAYNEYIVYYLQVWKWPDLKCLSDEEDCVRVLLVADPQILGEQSENPLLTLIFNWDSDRFLSKTYARVVPFFKPDVILFLGDLTDEGSYASKDEFYRYIKRIPSIFNSQYPIKHVWIPGDNDIGGENEPIYPEKIKMFNAAFKQPDIISVKYVDIYKTNYLTQLLPESQSHLSSNTTKVAISHMPLLLTPDRFSANVLTDIQPAVIFSGHRHSASYLEATIDTLFQKNRMRIITPKDNERTIEIDLKQDEFHEFINPTCSYRMGTKNVGYGAAVIDTANQKLQFAVLWSPQRFYHLKLYLASVLVFVLYIILVIMVKTVALTRTCRMNVPYSKV